MKNLMLLAIATGNGSMATFLDSGTSSLSQERGDIFIPTLQKTSCKLCTIFLDLVPRSHQPCTLGTPLLPPPKGVPGVIDQTRGLLTYVEKNCAQAVYTPELRYVCIAGRYIQGAPLTGNTVATADEILAVDAPSDVAEEVMVGTNDKPTPSSLTLRARFIGQGYSSQVRGRADVWGDGVIPEVSAHLEGVFDGVYHSPVGSDDEQRPWYGSSAILRQWVHHLLS